MTAVRTSGGGALVVVGGTGTICFVSGRTGGEREMGMRRIGHSGVGVPTSHWEKVLRGSEMCLTAN